MQRRTIAVIFFLLLGTFMYENAFVAHASTAIGTIYIRSDGTIDPSTAPISRVGDLYVLNSDILTQGNGIVINRSDIILDGASHLLEGSGNGTGITLANTGYYPPNIFNVTVMNLTITHFDEGIFLLFSVNNTIARNTIMENNYGLRLGMWDPSVDHSNVQTLFYENNIIRNYRGVWLDETANNLFFNNNFINNSVQIFCEINPASRNTWDKGYPEGGNYWSNYNGTDENSGKYQNETGSDGISDTAYQDNTIIGFDVGSGSMNLRDNYPLMNPINVFDTSQTTLPEFSSIMLITLFLSITLFTGLAVRRKISNQKKKGD